MDAIKVVDDVTQNSLPIHLVHAENYQSWLSAQAPIVQNHLTTFDPDKTQREVKYLHNANGFIDGVFFYFADPRAFLEVGSLPLALTPGNYYLVSENENLLERYQLAWGMGAYQFAEFRQPKREPACLQIPKADATHVLSLLKSIYLARDLINLPCESLGPTEFAQMATQFAEEHSAKIHITAGDELLKKNYPAIHMVGRASNDPPCLIDLHWGSKSHPKLTLVGKGVCFDSGGLDLKSTSGMTLMKKDMGGAANVLALAGLIMRAKLPVALRVLIPVVENVVSGDAYRPGDVVKSRSGITIEINNTDAEGRVILADALAEAIEDQPALLIDLATLTGAARVALGPDIPVLFCNDEALAADVLAAAEQSQDPLWRLPLHSGYKDYNRSGIADISNSSTESYGGAITAALFLQAFVPANIPWMHIDMMAWNLRASAGRPVGGEAMGLRALYKMIQQRFGG